MSNKTQLQTNNTALDGYIARINAAKEIAASLPEAGGGDTEIETCVVTINGGYIAYYTTFSEDGIMHGTNKTFNSSDSITVVKKTVFTIDSHYTVLRVTTTAGIRLINYSGYTSIYELLATASDTETIEIVSD